MKESIKKGLMPEIPETEIEPETMPEGYMFSPHGESNHKPVTSDGDLSRQISESERYEEQEAPIPRKIPIVKKEDILHLLDEIVFYCQVKGIKHVEVEDLLFKDFTISGKCSVSQLADTLKQKFNWSEEDATSLSRFMVEPSENTEIEFDEFRKINMAKAVTKLQSAMSTFEIMTKEKVKALSEEAGKKLAEKEEIFVQQCQEFDQFDTGKLTKPEFIKVAQRMGLQKQEATSLLVVLAQQNGDMKNFDFMEMLNLTPQKEEPSPEKGEEQEEYQEEFEAEQKSQSAKSKKSSRKSSSSSKKSSEKDKQEEYDEGFDEEPMKPELSEKEEEQAEENENEEIEEEVEEPVEEKEDSIHEEPVADSEPEQPEEAKSDLNADNLYDAMHEQDDTEKAEKPQDETRRSETTVFQSDLADSEGDVSSDEEIDLSKVEVPIPRQTYEEFIARWGAKLNEENRDPRIFIRDVIYHRVAGDSYQSFTEFVNLSRLRTLLKKIQITMTPEEVKSFTLVFEGKMASVPKLLKDLA